MKKTIIGRWVYIDLPDLDLETVKAKVDTGAYRSSLHCDFIEQFEQNGQTFLKIQTTDMSGRPIGDHAVVLKQERMVGVRSSNGQVQHRPVVLLPVKLADRQFQAEFTLSNRQDMKFPILLGRKFLRGRFIVDVSLDSSEEE